MATTGYVERDPADLSLCADCALHESLRLFVTRHAGRDACCGICMRTSEEAIVCSLEQRTQLGNVVRALIRLLYDEADYNDHFGGDSPNRILSEPNPILASPPTPEDPARANELDLLIGDLAARVPAPGWNEGVWIFHQNEGGLARAISKTESLELKTLKRRISRENHFKVEPAVRDLLGKIGTRIDTKVPPGQRFYRARLGVSKRLLRLNSLAFSGEPVWLPYMDAELGAPPAGIATIGRLNRNAVSFLYLASDASTAACEVRPHPGQELSVGEFATNRILRVADFDVDIADFSASDEQLELYHFVHSTELAMSRPVLPSATSSYSVTQLIADVLRQEGYDGVSFKSSIGPGDNICLFDPDAATYIGGSARVSRVEEVRYTLGDLATVQTQGAEDHEY